jgi:hypothetical protein
VRGADIDPFKRLGVDPSAEYTAARENKRVPPVVVYDGQFQVSIKRRAGDVFPCMDNAARALPPL